MEPIWLKNYPPNVPHEVDVDQFSSIGDMFLDACRQFGDRPAYTNFNTTITYGKCESYAKQWANFLRCDLALARGERVGLMLPNLLQYPICLFGTHLAGLTIVNLNPMYTGDELTAYVNAAEVKVIVVLDMFAHTLEKIIAQTQLKYVIVTNLGDCFSPLKRTFYNFSLKYLKRLVPRWTIDGAISFNDALWRGSKYPFEHLVVESHEIAFLQFTGGTTGMAKGAILTHRNMLANVEQICAWVGPLVKYGHEIIVTAIPLYHVFSLQVNCLCFCRFGGRSLLITNPRDFSGFMKTLVSYPFTVITGVNTLFNAMINHKKAKTIDFSNVKIAIGGGMPVQAAVALKWKKITNVPLLEGYGLTECSPVVTVNPLNLREYNGSIGLPLPNTMVAILDEQGQEVAMGGSGELCVKGPQVMSGYWEAPAETETAFSATGWLRTGDVAKIDEQGFIYLIERLKDMVLVSGFNVYPNEVEAVLVQHPDILEAAVIGVPAETTGEMVKAFVVPKNNQLTAALVRDYCKEHLAHYKVPKEIEFRTELPKTNVGKILRRVLREEAKL